MTEQKKKVKACKDTDYLFISAYLRAKEPQLLTEEKAVRMLSSSVQEAARTLEGCGYADVLTIGLDKALNDRRAAVFSEVEALAPKDGVVALFRCSTQPEPEKALSEIRRVLKDDGVLVAPTFTHADNAFFGKVKAFFMKLAGFPLHSKWTSNEYLAFLQENGWTVRESTVLKASFPLTYAECVKREEA